MAEAINQGGSPVLLRGFWGGAAIESRVGTPPGELLNPGDAMDRQKVFYTSVATVGDPESVWRNFWNPGGAMSTVEAEFSTAFSYAELRNGVIVPREVQQFYKKAVRAYVCCMGYASGLRHCDGTTGFLADNVLPQEYDLGKQWDTEKRDMVFNDPVVNFALQWVRSHAENGVLPIYWKLEKETKDPSVMDEYFEKTAGMIRNDPGWNNLRANHKVPVGIEEAALKIAMAYFIVEDLPAYQIAIARKLENGQSVFNYPNAPLPNPDRPDCGFLPFDNAYYSNFVTPDGILRAKGIFPNDPEIIDGIKDIFLNLAGYSFDGLLADRHPSEISVKELKRYGKVWDLLVGGSQGTGLADFSKFGEAIFALCNLYNLDDDKNPNLTAEEKLSRPTRASIVGRMVGDAVYVKTLAFMSANNESMWGELFKMLQLGDEDTPAELQKVQAGILGSQGNGFYGALQVVRQFGLRIGTEKYNAAIAMQKTGIKNPTRAELGRYGLAVASFFNRMTSGGGKKRR